MKSAINSIYKIEKGSWKAKAIISLYYKKKAILHYYISLCSIH